MSLKNAIKMIHIKKSYSIHFGHIQSILSSSSSIHFGSIRSTLILFGQFSPHWSYFVHSSFIRSILVLFGPFQFYSVDSGPIWSITFALVLIRPIILIRSSSVHYQIRSTLFPFGWLLSIRSNSVHLCLLDPFWSTLLHFIFPFLNRYIKLDWNYLK